MLTLAFFHFPTLVPPPLFALPRRSFSSAIKANLPLIRIPRAFFLAQVLPAPRLVWWVPLVPPLIQAAPPSLLPKAYHQWGMSPFPKILFPIHPPFSVSLLDFLSLVRPTVVHSPIMTSQKAFFFTTIRIQFFSLTFHVWPETDLPGTRAQPPFFFSSSLVIFFFFPFLQPVSPQGASISRLFSVLVVFLPFFFTPGRICATCAPPPMPFYPMFVFSRAFFGPLPQYRGFFLASYSVMRAPPPPVAPFPPNTFFLSW